MTFKEIYTMSRGALAAVGATATVLVFVFTNFQQKADADATEVQVRAELKSQDSRHVEEIKGLKSDLDRLDDKMDMLLLNEGLRWRPRKQNSNDK